MNRCPHCGISLADGDTNCWYCDAPVEQRSDNSRSSSKISITSQLSSYDAATDSAKLGSLCIICGKSCPNCEILSNGSVYHDTCYRELEAEIVKTQDLIDRRTKHIVGLEEEIRRAQTIVGMLRGIFGRNKDDLELKKVEVKRCEAELADSREARTLLTNKLSAIYDYWPDYPPDWDSRKEKARKKFPFCEDCGSHRGLLHVHHKIPIAKGGNHISKNLLVLCENCHSARHGGKGFSYERARQETAYAKRLKLIKQVLSENGIIRFGYKNRDKRRSVRSIQPREFIKMGESLCVRGYCYLRSEDRTFAVNRMTRVKAVDRPGESHFM